MCIINPLKCWASGYQPSSWSRWCWPAGLSSCWLGESSHQSWFSQLATPPLTLCWTSSSLLFVIVIISYGCHHRKPVGWKVCHTLVIGHWAQNNVVKGHHDKKQCWEIKRCERCTRVYHRILGTLLFYEDYPWRERECSKWPFFTPTHSIIQKDFSIFTKDFSIIHPFVSPFSSNFQTFTRLDQRDHYRQSLGLWDIQFTSHQIDVYCQMQYTHDTVSNTAEI